MSDTDIQETSTAEVAQSVVPVSDQPSEDGAPITAPEPPVAAAVAADADGVGPAAPADTTSNTPVARAAASDLEGDLRKVLDDYVSGVYQLPEGSLPTPHTLAAEIARRRADGKKVSSGAVSDALRRWVEIGFATLSTKPTAFVDYTDAARNLGLSALKQQHRAAKSAARKAVIEPAVAPPVVSVPVAPEAAASPVEATPPTAPQEPAPSPQTPDDTPAPQSPPVEPFATTAVAADPAPAVVNEAPAPPVETISDTGIRQDPATPDATPF